MSCAFLEVCLTLTKAREQCACVTTVFILCNENKSCSSNIVAHSKIVNFFVCLPSRLHSSLSILTFCHINSVKMHLIYYLFPFNGLLIDSYGGWISMECILQLQQTHTNLIQFVFLEYHQSIWEAEYLCICLSVPLTACLSAFRWWYFYSGGFKVVTGNRGRWRQPQKRLCTIAFV